MLRNKPDMEGPIMALRSKEQKRTYQPIVSLYFLSERKQSRDLRDRDIYREREQADMEKGSCSLKRVKVSFILEASWFNWDSTNQACQGENRESVMVRFLWRMSPVNHASSYYRFYYPSLLPKKFFSSVSRCPVLLSSRKAYDIQDLAAFISDGYLGLPLKFCAMTG